MNADTDMNVNVDASTVNSAEINQDAGNGKGQSNQSAVINNSASTNVTTNVTGGSVNSVNIHQ
jgi:hypothetical protein